MVTERRTRTSIVAGNPYRFVEYGAECCTCPGVDYSGADPTVQFPAGYHVRVGAGTKKSGAFHQDCAVFHDNKDRVRVQPYVTDAGVEVNVIRLEGDHAARTGGAMLLRPLSKTFPWADGAGLRTQIVFSPRDEGSAQWYFNFGLRGVLSFAAHNENVEALEVAVRQSLIKVLYYRDAVDGDGGGARRIVELPFAFEYNHWYALTTRLIPIPSELNTWDVKVKLQALANPAQKVVFRAEADERPNRIVDVRHLAFGDEHQGLPDGGVFLFSRIEDEPLDGE